VDIGTTNFQLRALLANGDVAAQLKPVRDELAQRRAQKPFPRSWRFHPRRVYQRICSSEQ